LDVKVCMIIVVSVVVVWLSLAVHVVSQDQVQSKNRRVRGPMLRCYRHFPYLVPGVR
jgi:hypothetical protein